jgi:hypothetical protein
MVFITRAEKFFGLIFSLLKKKNKKIPVQVQQQK